MPIRFELTPGQAHDAPVCKRLLDALQPGQYVLAPSRDISSRNTLPGSGQGIRRRLDPRNDLGTGRD